MLKKNHQTLHHYKNNAELLQDKQRIETSSLSQLISQDPQRFEKYSLEAAGLFLDYSKNLIDDKTKEHLLLLAEEAQLASMIHAMFQGKTINNTENQAVLHTALRNLSYQSPLLNHPIFSSIKTTHQRMEKLTHAIHQKQYKGWSNKPINTIVNIGIGGSSLGLKAVLDALTPYRTKNINCFFIDNIDPIECHTAFHHIDPETSLFIVASKSFKTLETQQNAFTARQWMLDQGMPLNDLNKHFIAISNNESAALEFGITSENIYPIWDGIGGRYSLWSSCGLIISLAVGFEHFAQLLEGAYAMDQHFLTAPFSHNMPVLLGLLGVWYHNYFNCQSYAVLPYASALKTFVEHLQQLDMESNGKTIDRQGQRIHYHTGPIIWGNVGTSGQHAYHQLLHQGSHLIPIDFIVPLKSHYLPKEQQEHLVANAFAQSQALMQGKKTPHSSNSNNEIHKELAGNRPSNTVMMEKITPKSVGALVALYEHKVFTQGVIWNINSFDQWGVEHGKVLGKKVFKQLKNEEPFDHEDFSTQGLIQQYQKY